MSCGRLLLGIVRSRLVHKAKVSCRTSLMYDFRLFESQRALTAQQANNLLTQSGDHSLEQTVLPKAAHTHETPSLLSDSEAVSGSEYDVKSFETMFRNSKFVKMLDPVGKKVEGEIIAVVGNNLYVDFGFKFHAVVEKPEADSDQFVEGAKVVLLLKDLEMTMHPLGSSRDISLLEAEAELCGLSNLDHSGSL